MRSASRDFEEPVKPTRRSTRQASVESVRAGNEYSEKEAFGAKRKLKQTIGGESDAPTLSARCTLY